MKCNITLFYNKQWLCVLLMTQILSGCTFASNDKITKQVEIDSWQYNKTETALETLTINAIKTYGKALINSVPKDIKEYCPNYKQATKMDRIKFWTVLISSLSYFESTHSSQVSYSESFTNSNDKPVVSRGLLQISLESSKGYHCNVSEESQLHQAQINLECGVKIMSKLISKDGVVSAKKQKISAKGTWLGAARYWSPFRDSKKKQTIAFNTKKQDYCH